MPLVSIIEIRAFEGKRYFHLKVAFVHSGNSSIDAAGDLVRDRVGPHRQFFGGYLYAILPSDKDYFITQCYALHRSYIERRPVHRDPARHRSKASTDYCSTHIRERSAVAVLISDRDRGDQRLVRSCECSPV